MQYNYFCILMQGAMRIMGQCDQGGMVEFAFDGDRVSFECIATNDEWEIVDQQSCEVALNVYEYFTLPLS